MKNSPCWVTDSTHITLSVKKNSTGSCATVDLKTLCMPSSTWWSRWCKNPQIWHVLGQKQFCKNILVRNCVSFVSDDCLQSVRHWTDEILHSGQRKWSPRFPKTTLECRHCLWLGCQWHKIVFINSCSLNAPNIFNRRQIWRIWRPISQ